MYNNVVKFHCNLFSPLPLVISSVGLNPKFSELRNLCTLIDGFFTNLESSNLGVRTISNKARFQTKFGKVSTIQRPNIAGQNPTSNIFLKTEPRISFAKSEPQTYKSINRTSNIYTSNQH